MTRERKIYDPSFKIKAVKLSNERSNITELSRELGIRVSMLYKWRKDYDKFGAGSFPGNGILKQTVEQMKRQVFEYIKICYYKKNTFSFEI